MTKIGRFVISTGQEAGVRPTHPAYHHYIVTDEYGIVQGHYASPMLAEQLAQGLHDTEMKKLDEEMENVLVRK